MNQNTKNVLGFVIGLGVLAVGYSALSFANSYNKSIPPSDLRSFTVTGQGKTIAIPDVAEFQFQVITQGGTDIASLQTQNTDATNKIISFVKSEGVADKDIKTEYFNVDPRYQTYNCNNIVPQVYNGSMPTDMPVQACPPSSIVGYTITQSVDVKIRDFTKIGDILGGVVTNGANQVGQLAFTLDDPTTAQNAARADAISKAQAEAQAIAQAGGFKLGPLLSVQDQGNYNPYPVYSAASGMAMNAVASTPAAAPSIQPGSQEIDMTEVLQYEIE